jgi:excisionase family DNA binding protein
MEMLTTVQAAAALGVNDKTLRRWADAGLVPFLRLPSGHRRWTPEQVAAIRARFSEAAAVKVAG